MTDRVRDGGAKNLPQYLQQRFMYFCEQVTPEHVDASNGIIDEMRLVTHAGRLWSEEEPDNYAAAASYFEPVALYSVYHHNKRSIRTAAKRKAVRDKEGYSNLTEAWMVAAGESELYVPDRLLEVGETKFVLRRSERDGGNMHKLLNDYTDEEKLSLEEQFHSEGISKFEYADLVKAHREWKQTAEMRLFGVVRNDRTARDIIQAIGG